MDSTSGRRRQPHRLILKSPHPQVLSFWTGQAAEIARNASAYEREGRLEQASDCWDSAGKLSPADPFTRRYCEERALICSLAWPSERIAA